jgi:hypothetical protein
MALTSESLQSFGKGLATQSFCNVFDKACPRARSWAELHWLHGSGPRLEYRPKLQRRR